MKETLRNIGADIMRQEFYNVFDQIPRVKAIRWTQGTRTYSETSQKFKVSELFFKVEDLVNSAYEIVRYGVYNPQATEAYRGLYGDGYLEIDALSNTHLEAFEVKEPLYDNEIAMLKRLDGLMHANKATLKSLFGDPEIITVDRRLVIVREDATRRFSSWKE